MEKLKQSKTSKETELVILKFPTRKCPDSDGFIAEFYKIFKELMPILHKLFQKNTIENFPNLSIYSDTKTRQEHHTKKHKENTHTTYLLYLVNRDVNNLNKI